MKTTAEKDQMEGVSITLTPEKAEELFYNALCNAEGTGYMGGYGLELIYKQSRYDEAKAKLQKAKPNEVICYEDILMEILRAGGKLAYKDTEGGEDTKAITLKDVHEKVQTMPIRHLSDMLNEEDDAETADVLLQTVFFGEIIYG